MRNAAQLFVKIAEIHISNYVIIKIIVIMIVFGDYISSKYTNCTYVNSDLISAILTKSCAALRIRGPPLDPSRKQCSTRIRFSDVGTGILLCFSSGAR